MRSYRQYCPLAKALDVIGDRWSLLIVRELLIRGPCRFTDVKKGVPGIATNMLAERLRELEQVGVIRREAAPPPVATTLFHLTPRGMSLRSAMLALVRWGAPLLAEAPDDDEVQTHWLSPMLEVLLADHAPDHPPITIEVRAGDEPLLIETVDGAVHTWPGTSEHPDGVLSGPPRLAFSVLAGMVPLADAYRGGLRYEGNPEALRRLQPGALIDD